MRAAAIAAGLAPALALLAAAPGAARADHRFQVDPTRLDLSDRVPAAALVVTNHGTAPLRLQLSAHAWHEDGAGAMQLAPTTAVVVRPSLVEIAPGDSRTIRVMTTARAGAVEQTFRVFAEELPDRRPPAGGRVHVRTRIGVPVFVVPAAPRVAAEVVARAPARAGRGEVTVRNTGTRHVKLSRIALAAVAGGRTRWTRALAGWYVLAGTERRFAVELGAARCGPGDRLVASITDVDGRTWASPPQPCEP